MRMAMRRIVFIIAGLFGLALLGGCSTVEIDKYRNQTPVLDLRDYFNGALDAHGIFQDRSGEVVKRFHVVIDERFTYSDGTTQRRVWTITHLGDGRYRGTADDVVGEARGEAAGNALRWRYVLALPVDGKVYNVDFDDWMFLMDQRVMLNRSVMSKWGFRLGGVTLSFYKRGG
jgi:hypothetical protein